MVKMNLRSALFTLFVYICIYSRSAQAVRQLGPKLLLSVSAKSPQKMQFIDAMSSEEPTVIEFSEESNKDAAPVADTEVSLNDGKTISEPSNFKELIDELVKLGWTAEESEVALVENNYDITSAAEYLDSQEETKEQFETGLTELSAAGWIRSAAASALTASGGNTTKAVEVLEGAEKELLHNFNIQVDKLVSRLH